MSDTLVRNYELAYHITADLEESAVQSARQDIEGLVTRHGGRISHSKDPEKIRLSYPIKKQRFAHFGHVQFSSDQPEQIREIGDELKLKGDVLRFLLLKLQPESKSGKAKDMVRRLAMRDKKSSAPLKAGTITPRPVRKEPAAVNEKELDKQLEDVIGKIEEVK